MLILLLVAANIVYKMKSYAGVFETLKTIGLNVDESEKLIIGIYIVIVYLFIYGIVNGISNLDPIDQWMILQVLSFMSFIAILWLGVLCHVVKVIKNNKEKSHPRIAYTSPSIFRSSSLGSSSDSNPEFRIVMRLIKQIGLQIKPDHFTEDEFLQIMYKWEEIKNKLNQALDTRKIAMKSFKDQIIVETEETKT